MDSSSPEISAATALSDSIHAAVESAGRAVVEINGGRRFRSSGVHWRQGIIVTVAHALRHDEDIRVTIAGGRSLAAKLVGRDAGSDLAVLNIDGADLPVTEIAEASAPKVGQLVLALGRTDGQASASLGIISLVGGSWRTWRGALIDQLIRPDIALYHGFSGGPLTDARGLTIGINTSGLSRYSALTIPASTINRVADELSKTGRVARGFLGVGLYAVRIPRRIVEAHGLPTAAGLIIVSVEPDGPADKAGLLVGDLLIALNGVKVKETEDVQSALDPELIGKPVVASIIRGGLPLEVAITVGERPRKTC
jgi:S1-C subfamily serine protease